MVVSSGVETGLLGLLPAETGHPVPPELPPMVILFPELAVLLAVVLEAELELLLVLVLVLVLPPLPLLAPAELPPPPPPPSHPMA